MTTRVTLVDIVAGEARLLGQVAVPSTIEPPHENAALAVLAAAADIGEMTGRRLLDGDSLIMPQTNERDGVDQVIAITSAAGLMGVVIAAIAGDVSGRSAQRAARVTYTSVLQTVTLDNAVRTGDAQDSTWIERQVQMLTGLEPDVVLLAGGLEEGAQDSLVRLAHIVGLTALSTRVDSDGEQRQDINAHPVIFAGNSQARERVIEALSGRARLKVVDNLRPSLESEQLDPARRELSQLYDERVLPSLPGMAALRRLCAAPVRTSCQAAGLITRFIGELNQRSVLSFDVGSASTTAHLHSQGRLTPAVLGSAGSGFGIGALLEERGVASIMRWLPFPISERDLTHWLLNKMLRPHIQPSTREDLLIEHAVAREAIALALQALRDERPDMTYDLAIGGGGVLANAPHPGLAALTMLDALQPSASDSVLAIDLHLDSLGLLGACGALALANPDAALTLYERDLLNNTPLATCIVALGEGAPGSVAIEAELRVSGEAPQQISVQHGQIGRLALEPGKRAQLVLRPASDVRIGRNPPGAEVSSEVAAIGGSALGVIIDARGRPLRLPDAPLARQQALWDWMVALGAESGELPYEVADPLPALDLSLPSITPISAPASLEPETPRQSEPSIAALPGDDLARLRQTVEEPKRRGLFGRK